MLWHSSVTECVPLAHVMKSENVSRSPPAEPDLAPASHIKSLLDELEEEEVHRPLRRPIHLTFDEHANLT